MAKEVSPEEMAQIFAIMGARTLPAMINAARESASGLLAETVQSIRENKPFPLVDRSYLVGSVQMEPIPDGAIVYVAAPYAGPLEYGTRPFTPPLRPLVEWAIRKGASQPYGLARAIQRKFADEGMKPKGYFARAVESWRTSGYRLAKTTVAALEQLSGDALDEAMAKAKANQRANAKARRAAKRK